MPWFDYHSGRYIPYRFDFEKFCQKYIFEKYDFTEDSDEIDEMIHEGMDVGDACYLKENEEVVNDIVNHYGVIKGIKLIYAEYGQDEIDWDTDDIKKINMIIGYEIIQFEYLDSEKVLDYWKEHNDDNHTDDDDNSNDNDNTNNDNKSEDYCKYTNKKLEQMCKERGIKGYSKKNKKTLIELLTNQS